VSRREKDDKFNAFNFEAHIKSRDKHNAFSNVYHMYVRNIFIDDHAAQAQHQAVLLG